ncbi:MAG: hypothetical protein KKD09_14900 [Gammaproteobacteria bacterium]|nr:hypothetical protein [Gammaproteobacteria bacterium]MBU4114541.1 hypothetical protein [Gammaproteobacteria bacterium]
MKTSQIKQRGARQRLNQQIKITAARIIAAFPRRSPQMNPALVADVTAAG